MIEEKRPVSNFTVEALAERAFAYELAGEKQKAIADNRRLIALPFQSSSYDFRAGLAKDKLQNLDPASPIPGINK